MPQQEEGALKKKKEEEQEALSKPHFLLRWVVLCAGSLMIFCSYYAYDIPSAIKPQLNEYFGRPSNFEFQFNLLYTLYAAPNVVLPFVGGYFVDRVGVRVCLVIFCSFVCLGQLIFALGVQTKSWSVMFLGRFVFGLGGESFSVGQSALLSDWFRGGELALAFGVSFALCKLGTVINNVVTSGLTDSVGIAFAVWFGLIICGVSMACMTVAVTIDLSADRFIARATQSLEGHHVDSHEQTPLQPKQLDIEAVTPTTTTSPSLSLKPVAEEDQGGGALEANTGSSARSKKMEKPKQEVEEVDEDEEEDAPATLADLIHLPKVFWLLVLACTVVYGCLIPFNSISSSLLLERDYFIEPSDSCRLQNPHQCQSDLNPPVNCPSSRWYQPPIPHNVTVDGDTYNPLDSSDIDCTEDSWSDGCLKEYCDRQDRGESRASVSMSIPYIITAAVSPFMGSFIDHFGLRAILLFIAPVLLIITHCLLGYSDVAVILPLVLQGLSYTLFAAVIWPAIPLVVEDRLTGLGFGILTAMQNLSCTIVPLIVAAIYADSDDKYIPNVELLFIVLAGVGVGVGVYVNYYDFFFGESILNLAAFVPDEEEEEDGDLHEEKQASSKKVALADLSAQNLQMSNANEGKSNKKVSFHCDMDLVNKRRTISDLIGEGEVGNSASKAAGEEDDVFQVGISLKEGYFVGEGAYFEERVEDRADVGPGGGEEEDSEGYTSQKVFTSGSTRARRSSSGANSSYRPRGLSFTVHGELYRGGGYRSTMSMLDEEGQSLRSRSRSRSRSRTGSRARAGSRFAGGSGSSRNRTYSRPPALSQSAILTIEEDSSDPAPK